jgi:hypothetical protein
MGTEYCDGHLDIREMSGPSGQTCAEDAVVVERASSETIPWPPPGCAQWQFVPPAASARTSHMLCRIPRSTDDAIPPSRGP